MTEIVAKLLRVSEEVEHLRTHVETLELATYEIVYFRDALTAIERRAHALLSRVKLGSGLEN